jgi:hypothetical protein
MLIGPRAKAPREQLERIHRSRTYLLGLTTDILGFRRLESSRVA